MGLGHCKLIDTTPKLETSVLKMVMPHWIGYWHMDVETECIAQDVLFDIDLVTVE